MNQFTTGIFYSSELAPKILRHCEVMKTPPNRTTVIDIKHDGFFKMYLISNLASFWISIWMFPKIMVPQIIRFNGGFPFFSPSILGELVPLFLETPIYQNSRSFSGEWVRSPSIYPPPKHLVGPPTSAPRTAHAESTACGAHAWRAGGSGSWKRNGGRENRSSPIG